MEVVSWIAIIVIVAAIAIGWSKRFMAAGALAVANLIIYAMTDFGPHVATSHGPRPVIHLELGLWSPNLHNLEPLGFLQLLTSMFVHADFFHILGNLIILLAFALPFEERIGHRRFLLLYLGAGLIGALAQVGAYWDDTMLLMGASGAVFGVIGAFAALYPRLVVPLPLPLLFIMVFVRMRVIVAALVFGGLQFLYLATLSPFDNTAYMAHIGGLAGGVLLAFAMRRTVHDEDPKPVKIDVKDLARFATDSGTKAALAQMEANMDEPAIFHAWWERFWKGARDPQSGQRVRPAGPGKVVREDGTILSVQTESLRS